LSRTKKEDEIISESTGDQVRCDAQARKPRDNKGDTSMTSFH